MKNRRLRQRGSQRGASLVEVLVALVLLVVGIYSIARLFPGGFFSLRSAENDTFADRLAQGQIEQLKENNNFLLDAVYMYSNQVGFFTDSSSISPTAAGTYTPPGGTTADASLADVNKARYVSGESFVVPAPNIATSATNGTSVHVLNDGPVVLSSAGTLAEPPFLPATPSPVSPEPRSGNSNPQLAAPLTTLGLPPVHSGPWTATVGNAPQGFSNPSSQQYTGDVPGSSDQPSDLLDAGQPQYAIDYTNQEIALAPEPYDQHFTLELKLAFPASGTGASAVAAETVTYYIPLLLPSVNATTNPYQGTWFNPMTNGQDTTRPVVTNLPVPTLPNGVFPTWSVGSAVLTRTLTPVATVTALKSNYTAATTDPYTYVVYSSDSTLEDVNLGVLALNPRLQGQTVSVSYLVYDWHILREDETVPTTTSDSGELVPSTQSPIHLTIDHLERVGDVLDNQTTYPGLFRNVGTVATDDATVGYDILVLDTDTGQSIGLTAPPVGTTGASVFDLDNSTGSSIQPGQFAVSYQNGYITLPNGSGTTSPSTSAWTALTHQHIRIFYSGDYDWAVALQKGPSLYQQGSTGVLLPGQYAVLATGTTCHLKFPVSDLGQTVEVNDIHYTDTSDNPQVLSTTSGTIATDYLDSDYVDIGSILPNVDLSKPITVGTVEGISARSLVVWKERGLWKSREVSTILTQ